MTPRIDIAGAGLAGLAAAIACARAGFAVRVHEQAPALRELGAGVQLSPNATRILRQWGVLGAVLAVATQPRAVCSMNSLSGRELAAMPCSGDAPFLSVLRADLQQVLATEAQRLGAQLRFSDPLHLGDTAALAGHLAGGAHAVLACDGIWSQNRDLLTAARPPAPTGHWAWRALVPLAHLEDQATAPRLPAGGWAEPVVRAWLGKNHHIVTYPVGSGRWLNVAAFTPTRHIQPDATLWAQTANAAQLRAALGPVCAALQGLLGALEADPSALSRWVVNALPPVTQAAQLAAGAFALLGDAAHAMRPYAAQGACMAIEDAQVAGLQLAAQPIDAAAALAAYAQVRCARVGRVQRHALRNERIFHLSPPAAWARDLALHWRPQLMGSPWLYGYDASA